MTKQDFIKKFPDVKVQQFETDTVLSKQEIKEMVKQFTNSLDMGLIYYEQCGCNVTVFTSDKMKSELNKMKPGYQVTEERSEPLYLTRFIVCGNYCVRVKFPSGEDVYDCDFFV